MKTFFKLIILIVMILVSIFGVLFFYLSEKECVLIDDNEPQLIYNDKIYKRMPDNFFINERYEMERLLPLRFENNIFSSLFIDKEVYKIAGDENITFIYTDFNDMLFKGGFFSVEGYQIPDINEFNIEKIDVYDNDDNLLLSEKSIEGIKKILSFEIKNANIQDADYYAIAYLKDSFLCYYFELDNWNTQNTGDGSLFSDEKD